MPVSPTEYAKMKNISHERKKLVADARKLVDAADVEKRAMTKEEDASWKAIMEKVDELGEAHDRYARMRSAEDEDEQDDEEEDEDRDEDTDDEEESEDEEDEGDRGNKKVIFKNGVKYVLQKRTNKRIATPKPHPMRKMPGETTRDFETRKRRNTPEYREVWNRFILGEKDALHGKLAQRAIQADSDIVGGYLIAPQEFVADLIKFVNNFVFVRSKATVYTVKSAQSLGAPSLDADPIDAVWTSELDTGNEDTSMSFGKRELTPHPLALREKVSNRLLRMATIASVVSADGSGVAGSPEALLRDRMGYKFAVAEEKAFLTGTGGNQPLGLFTASSFGIDTSRDITTANAGSLVGDDLISTKYNQKVQYWPRMEWIFHRTVLQAIRKLKDSFGQYLWVPGGFGGEGDKLLDIPVNMSEYAPSVISTGLYVGMLYDPMFYYIVDSLEFQLQRLVELYAAANMTGFIARMELDGMPVLAESATRIKVQ